MMSADYKERFQAEYAQLQIRYNKLKKICEEVAAGSDQPGLTLTFSLSCPISILNKQLNIMHQYLLCLQERAKIEHIDLFDL